MLLIMTYIFVYQLLYQTTYLEKEDPTGVIRFSIQQPTEDVKTKKPGCDPLDTGCISKFRSFKDLDYCLQSGLPRGFKQYPCRFWGSAEDATVFQSSALFATRVKEYNQINTCDPAKNVCNNLWNNTVPDETYFIADVESYTILFDHTAFAVNLNVTGGSRYAKGYIRTKNKKLCAVTPNSRDDPTDPKNYCLIEPNQTSTSLDIIELGVLLGAGGTSLEDASEVNNGHTVRYNGAVIFVKIVYKNFQPMTFNQNLSHVTYQYEISALTGTTAKDIKTIYEKYPNTRVVQNRHGIRVVVVQTGQLARGNIQAFLLTLTASLTLLAISNTVVDSLAIYVLPQKDLYKKFKYKITPDFSDYMDIKNRRKGMNFDEDDDGILYDTLHQYKSSQDVVKSHGVVR